MSVSTAGPTQLQTVSAISPLRRVPAGAKFVALFVLAVVIYASDAWSVLLGGLVVALAALALSAVPAARLIRALAGVLVLIAFIVAIAAITRGWDSAARYGVRLLALCLFAYAVTATTHFSEMLTLFQHTLAPFDRIGLPTAQISLALAMTVRLIPQIRDRYFEIREAQFARGLANNPRAVLVPLIAATLSGAHELAAAIDARCYDSAPVTGRLRAARRQTSVVRDTESLPATTNTVLVATLAALIAALGLVPPITIGIVPVPITLQTLGVMLAGGLLGPWRGMLAALLVVTLGFAGLPLFSGGRGGLGMLVGPTGGYAVGWVPGAYVVGLLVKYLALRPRSVTLRYVTVALAAIVGGIGVVYAFGVPWTSVSAGISLRTSLIGSFSFVPGDCVKAVLAALVTVTLHRRYPTLLGR